jgi:hypothetical protein
LTIAEEEKVIGQPTDLAGHLAVATKVADVHHHGIGLVRRVPIHGCHPIEDTVGHEVARLPITDAVLEPLPFKAEDTALVLTAGDGPLLEDPRREEKTEFDLLLLRRGGLDLHTARVDRAMSPVVAAARDVSEMQLQGVKIFEQ